MASSFQPNEQAGDLQATQKLLRATLDSSMDMIQVFEAVRNQHGEIIDFIWLLNNHASRKVYGDVVGKSLLQVQPGVVEEGIFAAFKQVVETGQSQQYEKHYVHEQFDGWFYQSVVKLNDGVATTTADITARKNAERQLRQSKELVQTVFDVSLNPIAYHKAIRDERGRIVDFEFQVENQQARKYAEEDRTGKRFLEAYPGINDTVVFELYAEVVETGKALNTEVQLNLRGTERWFHLMAVKLDDGLVATALDITERKKAQEEILRLKDEVAQQAEDKYKTLFNSVDDGFVIVELIYDDTATPVDFIYRENNPAFIKHVGMDLRGKRRSELALDQKDFLLEKYGHVVATGEPVHFEYNVQRLGEQWFEATVARIGPEGSRQVGVIFRNTTERKNAEEAIRQSEEKYRTLFETIEEGFCIMELVRDEKGDVADVVFREANKAFERHTGLTNVVGKRSTELIPNQDPNRFQDYQDLSETGETTLSEIYITDINRWLRLYRLRLGPPGSNLLAAVFEDITERKQREQQQDYLLGLNDALRPLSDPIAVQRVAMRVLGEQLGVDRAIYAEINLDNDWCEATDNYTSPSVQPVTGRFPFAAFGPPGEKRIKGEILVIDDVSKEVEEDAQQAFYSIDVQAVVAVPLIKNGKLVADLSVHQTRPRHWLPHEIALVYETAERTWAALERAKAEAALAESGRELLQAKEQLELSISAGKIGVWYWDLTTDTLQWSKEQEELYGLQEGEFSGGIAEFRTYVHPDAIQDVATVEAVNKLNEGEYAEDFQIIRKDGAVRWIHSRSRKILDAAGQLLYIVGVNMDITDRKEAEDALRESEEKFRTLSNTAPALIWHNDEKGENRFINQQFVDYTGLTLDEINGAGWHTIVHPDEREAYVADYLSAALEKRAWSAQCRIRRFDGQWRWFDNQAQPLFGAAGAYGGHVGVTIDINERKRREANLSFLAGLMSDFAPLSTVEEIMNLAGMRLVNHLGLSHCFFVEVNQEAGECTVLYHFLPNEEQKITGTYKLAVFHTEEDNRILASGQSMVVDNVEDGIRSPEQAAAYKALNICALINTPHIDQGRWVFDVGIGRPHPGVWQPDEIELMQEVSARVWIRLERAKAEEALRRSEQRYRTLIDNLPDYAIYQLNGDGIISEWLEGAQRLTGYAPGEIIGQSVSLLYPPQAQRAGDPADELREALRTGRAERESLKVRKNGEYFWANEITTAIESERVQGFVKISRDISRRKQAQEALRQLEQRTRLAVEAAEMATWEWHLLTDEVYWNEQHFRLLGMEPQPGPVHSQTFICRLHPDDRLWVTAELQRVIKEQTLFDVEFRIVRDDGVLRWMSGYGRVTRLEAGVPLQMSGVMLDVTDRKEAEEALKHSRERLQKALSIPTVGVIYFNLEGAILDANEAFQRMSGYARSDFTEGRVRWDDLTPPEFIDVTRIALQEYRTLGENTPYEKQYIRPDGSRWWGLFAGKQLEEDDFIEFVLDISASKQARQALEEADRRKDEFLAMLAHELRNPMSTLRSGLTILDLTITDEVTRSTLTMMDRQTDHLVRMVDDLLDVSLISRGKIELKKGSINLVDLVRQAQQSLFSQFEQQGKVLHSSLPNTPVELDGDATRLTQVVANLLTNGLRYTGEDGQVWVSLIHQHQEAILQVRDNGIGLAEDQQSAIFELFVQVDNSLARSKGGLGLGLTLVKRLVDMHGGRVDVYSEGLGKGSIFTVHLPTLTTAGEPSTKPVPRTTDSAAASRILIIDDNADAALMMATLLKLKGYEAHSRTSGRAGLEAAERLQPAVILLDIGMPELDGYATCRLIREQARGQDVVVIALTGYGQEEDRQRTQEAGFDGHLVKPVDLSVLTTLVTELLNKGTKR